MFSMLVVALLAQAPEGSVPETSPTPATLSAPPQTVPAEKPVAALPPAFSSQVLWWDRVNHRALQGGQHTPLSREEFFRALGKPELIDQSHRAFRNRVIFLSVGAAALAAGIIGGMALFAQTPDLNGPFCNPYGPEYVGTPPVYNDVCVPRVRLFQALGSASIVVGTMVMGLLSTLAYWSDPKVVSDDEAERLISHRNGELLQQLRQTAWVSPTVGGFSMGTGFRF